MDGIQAVNSSSLTTALLAAQSASSVTQALIADSSATLLGTSATSSFFTQFSVLGQTQAASSLFQDQMAALQTGSSNTGQEFGKDLQGLTGEAQNFVDAFNNLQASLDSFGQIGATGGLNTGFTLASSLNALAQSSFTNGDSNLTKLSQIGINFQPSLLLGRGSALTIDATALASAFASDPAGTFSLLASAASGFEQLASTNTNAPINSGLTLALLLDQANLTDPLFGDTASSSSGLFQLLLLGNQAAISAETPTLLANLAALSQFATVSQL